MEKDKSIIVKIVPSRFNDDCALKDLVRYILTDKRTKDKRRYTGGKGVDFLNWKNAAEQFEIVQEFYTKKSKRRIYHMVISFPENEDDLYKICMFAQRVIESFFEGHQCVFAVHENTDNLHIHIGWNAVNYRDGRKWHMSKFDFEEMKDKMIRMWRMN